MNIFPAGLSYLLQRKIVAKKLKIEHIMIEHIISRLHLNRFRLLKFPIVGLLVLAALGLMASGARAANFTATLDRDAIALGETATLSLAFEGAQPKNVPTPDVPGLQIVNSGTSQNVSFINGAMSSTVTITYSVTPQRTGEFTIPAMTADLNGQQFGTQPLKLTVTQPNAPSAAVVNSGSEIAFMKLLLPQKKIYAGQMLTAQLQVCWRDDAQNFGNFQLTGTPADGFIIGKIAQGQGQRVQIGNRIYTVVPFTVVLAAEKSGAVSLGPFTASAAYVVPSPNDQGADPIFRQFFNQGRQVPVSLATETVNVECLPLPQDNKPANFSGAVGNFALAASVGPTNVTVGDPVTVRVQISGRGALDAIQLPDQSALSNFKVFPPTSKTEISDQLGLEGKKTFEEIVTPQNSDVRAWPQFSFSFFNPDDGKYYTLTQPAVPLAVHSAGSTPMPTIAANKNSTPENQTSQDILPIKENLGALEMKTVPLVRQPAFIALQTLPILTFLAAFVWRKRADNLANNPRLRRKLAVEKLLQNGIADLRKFAAENNSEGFFALLFRLLQEQLGERLDCPATAITENVVEENSILRGANETTRNDLRELFQLCNQARYAPVRGTSELNSVAAQFEKVIGELQEVKT
jgi:oxygen tolerance protein BatD